MSSAPTRCDSSDLGCNFSTLKEVFFLFFGVLLSLIFSSSFPFFVLVGLLVLYWAQGPRMTLAYRRFAISPTVLYFYRLPSLFTYRVSLFGMYVRILTK